MTPRLRPTLFEVTTRHGKLGVITAEHGGAIETLQTVEVAHARRKRQELDGRLSLRSFFESIEHELQTVLQKVRCAVAREVVVEKTHQGARFVDRQRGLSL